MIRPLNYRQDLNYYLFFDVETTPTYFILKNEEKIEDAKKLSLLEYKYYLEENERLRKIKYNIGMYQTTKLISLFDEDNNCNCFIVDDALCDTELEQLITENYKAALWFNDSPEEIIDDFWKTIDKYMYENLNCRLFAHNIGFDSKQIDLYNRINNFEGKILKNMVGKSEKIASCSLSQPFFIKCRYDSESMLSFDDSYSFFAKPLKSLGDDIGIPKLDFDFDGRDLIVNDECIEYCCNDTYIIKEAIVRLKQYLSEKELGFMQTTLSGTCMNVWRTSYLNYPIENDYKKSKNPDEIIKIERSCYHGGRNECLKIGRFENIYYHDINSLYPYVMEKYPYPVEYRTTIKEGITIQYINELLNNNGCYCIFECSIDTKKNHIPYKNSRLMFIHGKFNGYIHQPEFKYFYERGEVLKVKSILVYRADFIFKDYINFFKQEKYKNEDNETYRQLSKYFQNCLYGKLAQHNRESTFHDNGEAVLESVDILDDKGIKQHRIDYFGYFAVLNKEDINKNSKTAFPCIAGAVTSYARMELARMIDLLGIENVLYYDTDSIMSNVPIPDKYIHDKEYGKWKNEADKLYKKAKIKPKKTMSVIIKGCKNYILYDNNKILSIKSKGIKKDSKEIDDDIYSTNRWWTVKTSKVKKETMFTLSHTVIMHELKQNTLEYLKGKTICKGKEEIILNGVKIKYNVRKIIPWKLEELEKLDNET